MSEISDNKKPRIQVLQDRIRNLRLERDQLRAELHESKATLAAIKKVVHATTLIVTGEDGNPVEREPNLVGCVQLVEAERDRLRGLYKQRDQWRECLEKLDKAFDFWHNIPWAVQSDEQREANLLYKRLKGEVQ